MAEVYILNDYRSSKLEINGGPPPEIFEETASNISLKQVSFTEVNLICDETRQKIQKAKVFMEECQKACELQTIEEMIIERDRILDKYNINVKK